MVVDRVPSYHVRSRGEGLGLMEPMWTDDPINEVDLVWVSLSRPVDVHN